MILAKHFLLTRLLSFKSDFLGGSSLVANKTEVVIASVVLLVAPLISFAFAPTCFHVLLPY